VHGEPQRCAGGTRCRSCGCAPCRCSPPRVRRRCHGSLWKVLLLLLAAGWLLWLLRSLARLCRLASSGRGRRGNGTVPPWAYRQPDPLIYSQQYLQAQGLAVTWDNPDIHLELPSGVAVDSHSLAPDTDYVVVARVWNGATTAPAIDLPVKVSYLEFGIGTVRHDVGLGSVDLPVKGAPGSPAFARVPWRTPPISGHYCLQVELLWDDDANPANNMGQHNTDVRRLNSPRAASTFTLRNDDVRTRLLRLEVDGYRIPPQDPCPPEAPRDDAQRRRAALGRHDRDAWPVAPGWDVVVRPREARLGPGESTEVAVELTAPDGFSGREVVNVHAFDGGRIVGGVTLYVEGEA
jgi:hypothetical protein